METINNFLRALNKYVTLKHVAYGAFLLVGAYVAFKKAKIVAGRQQMKSAANNGVQTRVLQPHELNSQVITTQMANPIPQQGMGAVDYSSQIKTLQTQLGALSSKLRNVEGENIKMRKWIDAVQESANTQENGPNMPDGVDPNGRFYFEGDGR